MDEIDAETLAYAKMYTGGFDRRDLTRTVFSEYASTWWTVDDFLSDMQDAVAKIPEEKRALAKVELEGGYDESTELKISYPDVETDEELNERIQRAISAAISRNAEERGCYERLKAKFEQQ